MGISGGIETQPPGGHDPPGGCVFHIPKAGHVHSDPVRPAQDHRRRHVPAHDCTGAVNQGAFPFGASFGKNPHHPGPPLQNPQNRRFSERSVHFLTFVWSHFCCQRHPSPLLRSLQKWRRAGDEDFPPNGNAPREPFLSKREVGRPAHGRTNAYPSSPLLYRIQHGGAPDCRSLAAAPAPKRPRMERRRRAAAQARTARSKPKSENMLVDSQ